MSESGRMEAERIWIVQVEEAEYINPVRNDVRNI